MSKVIITTRVQTPLMAAQHCNLLRHNFWAFGNDDATKPSLNVQGVFKASK